MSSYQDFKVKTFIPDSLRMLVMQIARADIVDGSYQGQVCTVRCFDDADYLKFVIKNRGYGEIVNE